MAEISTQAVIDAITLALRAAFPDAVIVDEQAGQGMRPGAFNVEPVNTGQRRFPGLRYHRTPMFDVIYYSNGSAEECISVADSLCEALDMVRTPGGDLLHGSGLDWRVDDDVLHCIVGYDHYVRRDTAQEPMETLHITEGGFYG